jgi:hypothetical protein
MGEEASRFNNTPRRDIGLSMLLLEMFSETALPECVPDIYIQLEQWHRAFSKVLQFPRTPDGASPYVAATTLYIQLLSLEIPLHQYPNFNVVGSDHSIVAILDLGRTLVGHPGFPKSFVFDMVTIPAIWMIVALCPSVSEESRAGTSQGHAARGGMCEGQQNSCADRRDVLEEV